MANGNDDETSTYVESSLMKEFIVNRSTIELFGIIQLAIEMDEKLLSITDRRILILSAQEYVKRQDAPEEVREMVGTILKWHRCHEAEFSQETFEQWANQASTAELSAFVHSAKSYFSDEELDAGADRKLAVAVQTILAREGDEAQNEHGFAMNMSIALENQREGLSQRQFGLISTEELLSFFNMLLKKNKADGFEIVVATELGRRPDLDQCLGGREAVEMVLGAIPIA